MFNPQSRGIAASLPRQGAQASLGMARRES